MSELLYPHGGGAEYATYLYARLLSESGISTVVVTNRFSGEPEISRSNDLTVYRLPLLKGTDNVKYSIFRRVDVLLSGFMKNLIKWADVVYVPRFWFSAVFAAKAYGKPVIMHLHDYIPVCPLANLYNVDKHLICSRKGNICSSKCVYVYERTGSRDLPSALASVLLNTSFQYYIRRVTNSSTAIVCVSRAQRDLIGQICPHLLSRISVIYNPLPEMAQLEALGDDLGYFGGSNYMKGFPVLFRAASLVTFLNGKPKIHATKFSCTDELFDKTLNRIGILTYGKLSSRQYDELRKQIRTVIVPSVWAEPLPYVVTEALCGGRIVVASRIGGIPEEVEGCQGAFLFTPGDYKELAELLLYVKSLSKDVATDLGERNKETVMMRFDNKKISADFVGLLDRISK